MFRGESTTMSLAGRIGPHELFARLGAGGMGEMLRVFGAGLKR